MKEYLLRLFNDGDIDIITEEAQHNYRIVYHKTLNKGEKIKDNLFEAYEEWENLCFKENNK